MIDFQSEEKMKTLFKNYDALYKNLPATQKMLERQALLSPKDGARFFDVKDLVSKKTDSLK